MVSRKPSISRAVFSFDLIIFIVFSNLLIPSKAKYSHCTGMMTESAAVSALMVINPNEGEQGVKSCITINPKTDIHALDPYLGEVDMVLLMSVEAGYGGQSFIPESVDRLRYLREAIDSRGLSTWIEVDGGINTKNAPLLWEAGADILVAGSAVFQAPDPIATIDQLKQ